MVTDQVFGRQNTEWRMENGEWRMENGDGDHAMVAAASFPRIAVAATLVVASCVSAGTSSVAAIILTTE